MTWRDSEKCEDVPGRARLRPSRSASPSSGRSLALSEIGRHQSAGRRVPLLSICRASLWRSRTDPESATAAQYLHRRHAREDRAIGAIRDGAGVQADRGSPRARWYSGSLRLIRTDRLSGMTSSTTAWSPGRTI